MDSLLSEMNNDNLQVNMSATDFVQNSKIINNSICRVCAQMGDKLINIYSEEGSAIELEIKINTYLPINVLENDALPLQCCWQCSSAILAWHDLYLTSLEADNKLRSYYLKQELEDSSVYIEVHFDDAELENKDIEDSKSIIIETTEYGDTETVRNICDPEKTRNNNNTGTETNDYYQIADIANLKCRECNKFFKYKKTLKGHVKNVHKIKVPCIRRSAKEIHITFPCLECNKPFTRKSDLAKHIRTFHLNVKLMNAKSGDSDVIQKLIENSEYDETDIGINSSDSEVNRNKNSNRTDILNDYYKIADVINLKCRECNESFRQKKSLRNHIQKVHNVKFPSVRRKAKDIDATFTCFVCNKSFTRKFDLEKHVRTFHPSADLPLPKKRSRNSDVIQKCRIKIGDSTVYKCDYCDKMFKKMYTLGCHRLIHTNERKSCCQICGKKFRTNAATSRHVRECHDNIKNFQCSFCDDKFKNKASLVQHENIHTDNRPFVCDICGKSYRQHSSLYTHKLFHKSKDFPCQICSRKFSRKSEAKRHSLIHTGERPHKCTECGRGFSRRIDLNHHARVHLKRS